MTKRKKSPEDRALKVQLGHPAAFEILQPANSIAGQIVNEASVLSLSAWHCGVKIISETMARLPCLTYERTKKGKREAPEYPLYDLLHTSPNREMTAFAFWEVCLRSLLQWGNFYAEIEQQVKGTPVALWPLQANHVTVARDNADALVYKVQQSGGASRTLDSSQVFHVHACSEDGLVGRSPISVARESLGQAMAIQSFASKFYGQGLVFSGALTRPGKLTPQAKKELRQSIKEIHSGDPWQMLLLEEGMDWKSFGMPLKDAEFLASRKWSTVEIAQWLNIPPTLLKDYSSGKYNNVEQQAQDFVDYTLSPFAARIEQEVSRKLILPGEPYYTRFKFDDLLRANTIDRYTASQIALQNGIKNVDEVRSEENLDALPDGIGQDYLKPLNMTERDNTLSQTQLDGVLVILDRYKQGLPKEIATQLIDNVAPDLKLNLALIEQTNEQPVRVSVPNLSPGSNAGQGTEAQA